MDTTSTVPVPVPVPVKFVRCAATKRNGWRCPKPIPIGHVKCRWHRGPAELAVDSPRESSSQS